MIACSDFSAVVIVHVFNFFVAFPLAALKILKLPKPFVSDSIPIHSIIYSLWLNLSYFSFLGIIVADELGMLNVLCMPFFISLYCSIIHLFYPDALLKIVDSLFRIDIIIRLQIWYMIKNPIFYTNLEIGGYSMVKYLAK